VFGLTKPKLPISSEDKEWTDQSFVRLAGLLGSQRLRESTVMLPTPEHFPDPYDGSEESLQVMFRRVAKQMQVDPDDVELTLFMNSEDLTRDMTPFYSGKSSGAAGLYYHEPAERAQIAVKGDDLKDPLSLVASLAHEIGHIILLRPGLVKREESDMEPLNDLLTVFLGFGVFTANCAFRFEQHQSYDRQGWSARRQGYLSEQMFGYALARFAYERAERKPKWVAHLATNVAGYFKQSMRWLESRDEPQLLSDGGRAA